MKFSFLTFLKEMTSVQKVFLLLQLLAAIFAVISAPDTPGLYTHNLQFLPLVLALPFFIPKCLWNHSIKSKFATHVFWFSGIAFLGLALDYLFKSHAGIVQLAIATLPAFAIWLFRFIRWNINSIRQKECLQALAFSSISWGSYALAFPPLPLGILAPLLLVPWFLVLSRYSKQAVLFATFWSGMLYNTINYYWIYNVMKVGPAGLILFGLFLLICYFSLYNVCLLYTSPSPRDS